MTELGKYIDFHATKDSGKDFDARFVANGDGQILLNKTTSGNGDGTLKANLLGNIDGGVIDYNNGNKAIRIGYSGSGLTTSNLNYIAGYTDDGTKIKDVSKDVLKSWLGNGVSASG